MVTLRLGLKADSGPPQYYVTKGVCGADAREHTETTATLGMCTGSALDLVAADTMTILMTTGVLLRSATAIICFGPMQRLGTCVRLATINKQRGV
eukprot:688312-Amphidinium_carterae.1